jgi:hypothetical protein
MHAKPTQDTPEQEGARVALELALYHVEELIAAVLDATDPDALVALGADPAARLAAVRWALVEYGGGAEGYALGARFLTRAIRLQTPNFLPWARAHWPADPRFAERAGAVA